ncbi:MAG: M48 family metallopeptidase [Gammaproteobacteria bacterium]|nr:M48 family metallopeptidase [Gammaproteobacteria bacterium]
MAKVTIKIIKISFTGVLCGVVFGCTTVAETGRSQLLLVSPSQEIQMGLSEFEKQKASTPISKDAAKNSMIQAVGKRISAVAELPNAQWEFVLFDSPDVPNAYCLPGGKVGIYSGILPITLNEVGMATVIAHEVAHAVARHGAERVSQGLVLQLGGQILQTAMQTQSAATQGLIMSAYGVSSKVGVALPHSRKQELEADQMGLIYMARAGYDPREAVKFWQRFRDFNYKNGQSQPEFLSTHPLDENRISQIQSLMPQAMAEYEKYK